LDEKKHGSASSVNIKKKRQFAQEIIIKRKRRIRSIRRSGEKEGRER
jgi:hypothetical protein